MNARIQELKEQAMRFAQEKCEGKSRDMYGTLRADIMTEKFAELIVEDCINKIETHRIPVGNSAAGEMACEWTYAALKEIRDEIKEHFGVEE